MGDLMAADPSKRAVIYLRVSTTEQAHAADAAEGYSIPAQREACRRKAAELGATVVAEFTDRGESARTAARPQLRAMLDHLASHAGVDYVIVYKIDRLARNRADDVQIQLGIERAGARLVSVSESVDDTPSGRLVRNIMSDLAEFYSANLATEILKGTTQKAQNGGTPHLAPLGYLNVRRIVGGHEERTIAVDEERAPYVRRAFELYATGNYSLRQLLALLTAEGMTARPTGKIPARPLSLPRFAKLMRDPYYIGLVTYRGVTYPGKHPPLITSELFATVGRILDDRDRTCLKQRRHRHYLRGLLTCRRCGSRLMYTLVTGKTGGQFAYYVCSARHRGKGCTLPYLSADDLEARLARAWLTTVRLDRADASAVLDGLRLLSATDAQRHTITKRRATTRLAQLDKERRKLLELAYADALPTTLVKEEQERIAREAEQAQTALAETANAEAGVEEIYQAAAGLMQRTAKLYTNAVEDERRLLNRAFLARIMVDSEREEVDLATPWVSIVDAATALRKDALLRYSRRRSQTNPEPIFSGRGSSMKTLVGLEAQLANSNPQIETLLVAWRALPSDAVPRLRRPKRAVFFARQRLGADGLERLVRDYESGLSLKETAAKYGVAKDTALRVLRAHGVAMRPSGVNYSYYDRGRPPARRRGRS
ncbi:MAG: recombinase family protein [Frankiaceae bacterium]